MRTVENLAKETYNMENKMLEKFATSLSESFVRRPYRGYGRLNNLISRLTGSPMTIRRIHGFDFSFETFDPYWNLLLSKSFVFEPEVEAFLRDQLKQNTIFLDCGANYGFWTLFALNYTRDKNCISIEASPATFEHLKRNIELNNRHPRLINRAVSCSCDTILEFQTSGKNHAGASISGMKKFKTASTVNVRTIDIKSALEGVNPEDQILIKLDVEGAEIDAFKGLGNLVEKYKISVIYEEGNKDCQVTEFLKKHASEKWYIFEILPCGKTSEIDFARALDIASHTNGPINLVASNFKKDDDITVETSTRTGPPVK